MPIYTDPDGGGTPSTICAVSPSDMAGNIDNILSRLEALEQEVAELKAQNTSAIQLSDISNNVGWVYNVTYMGVEGWTQTQAGTLIPPAGFTVSQILADAEARDQLSTSGSSAISDFLVVEPSSTSLSGSGLNATANLSTVLWSKGDAFDTGDLNISQINILQDGFYHVSVVMLTGVRATSGSTWMEVLIRNAADATVKSVQDLYGQHAVPNNQNQTLKVSFTFKAFGGYDIKILFNNTTGSLFTIASCIVSVERLGNI